MAMVLLLLGGWLLLTLLALPIAVGAARAGHAEDVALGYVTDDDREPSLR